MDGTPPWSAATYPWLGTDRDRTGTACPTCGRTVDNTARSLCAHWVDADRCSGPPRRRPRGVTDVSRVAWRDLRAAIGGADTAAELFGHGKPGRADADGSGSAVSVPPAFLDAARRTDGTFPWLDFPDRGWGVPCPACEATVTNERGAFLAHWREHDGCAGPTAVPARTWRRYGLEVTPADLRPGPAGGSARGDPERGDEASGAAPDGADEPVPGAASEDRRAGDRTPEDCPYCGSTVAPFERLGICPRCGGTLDA